MTHPGRSRAWPVLLVLGTVLVHADEDRGLKVRQMQSEKRVALVIGNAAYRPLAALKNSVNDARAVAVTLREMNFEVVERLDATRRDVNDAIKEFAHKLQP